MNHEHQAAAFLDLHRRSDFPPWEEAFGRWADGKDFAPYDRAAIRSIVHEELFGQGHTTHPPEERWSYQEVPSVSRSGRRRVRVSEVTTAD